ASTMLDGSSPSDASASSSEVGTRTVMGHQPRRGIQQNVYASHERYVNSGDETDGSVDPAHLDGDARRAGFEGGADRGFHRGHDVGVGALTRSAERSELDDEPVRGGGVDRGEHVRSGRA